MERMEQTIKRHFYHRGLRDEIRRIIRTCDTCQKMKTGQRQFGQLAPREALATPWQEVHTDTIGPWTLKLAGGKTLTFLAQTNIDPVTNLLEIATVKNTTSKEAARVFQNNWLARYPRPVRCVHDNGPEFSGTEFDNLLNYAGIQNKSTTSDNPQGNGICERVHATVGNVIRVMCAATPPHTTEDAQDIVEDALSTAMHATRCASHGSLNNISPGTVVFHRDMFLDLPFVADLIAIQKMRQRQVDMRLIRANAQRISKDWKVGDMVLVRGSTKSSDKAYPRFRGAYPIIRVHTNGNVTVRHNNGVEERVNIRRIKPYNSPP